jgi:hypothetical protein
MIKRYTLRVLTGLALLATACENDDGGRADDGADGGGSGINPSGPPDEDPPPADPGEYLEGIEGEFMAASAEFDVPIPLLKAVAFAESQWMMVEGQEEFEGYAPGHGVMALRGEHLARAAELLGVDEERVQTDRATNIRGAAAVLDDYAGGIDRKDLGAWAPAAAKLADVPTEDAAISYIHHHVYGLIKNGLVITDLSGEVVSEIEAEPTVVPDFPAPDGPTLATDPDHQGAIYRNSPHQSNRPAGNTGKVQMVIIHSCEGKYAGCWGWLVNQQSKVSAHYVVKEDGSEISQLVKESKKAWHIAATYKCSLNGKQECDVDGTSSNNFTVGIEHAGFAKQDGWHANLIEQSAKLVCGITSRHGIPRDKFHIVAHGQLQPNNRIDPGPNWPWATYLNKIAGGCGNAPMDPPPDPMDPPPDPMDPPPDPMDPPMNVDPAEIVVDSNAANNDPVRGKFTVSGNWTSTASTPGYYGSNYYFVATSPVSDAATFEFFLNNAGSKKVEIWYTAGANRSAAAPVVVFDSAGAKLGTVNVNMQQGGKAWSAVGTFNFKAGWNKISVSRWAAEGFVVIADAVRISNG